MRRKGLLWFVSCKSRRRSGEGIFELSMRGRKEGMEEVREEKINGEEAACYMRSSM